MGGGGGGGWHRGIFQVMHTAIAVKSVVDLEGCYKGIYGPCYGDRNQW